MIEVKKKERERFDSLLRRFNREVQQSGILTIVKQNRFFETAPNRRLRRQAAIRKNVIRKIRRGY